MLTIKRLFILSFALLAITQPICLPSKDALAKAATTREDLDVKWIFGNCAERPEDLQVYQFDKDTFILRQSKCLNAEGPFLYLLFGRDKAVLLDSGASPSPGRAFPLRSIVQSIISMRLSERRQPSIDLIVAHTHSHGDHFFADEEFKRQPHTVVVGKSLSEVKNFFGLSRWPDGMANLDLGGRMLTVIPIPGHEPTHIAVYDANTKILFTGDTLYPGVLTVDNWAEYRQSVNRLSNFAATKGVSLILGAHIEMKRTPGEFYNPRTPYQPDEHVLRLGLEHLLKLRDLCEAMGDRPQRKVSSDFVIEPLRN